MAQQKAACKTEGFSWRDAGGELLACAEKRKVLDENLGELTSACRDALDDALLLGCGESVFRQALQKMIVDLKPTVRERK